VVVEGQHIARKIERHQIEQGDQLERVKDRPHFAHGGLDHKSEKQGDDKSGHEGCLGDRFDYFNELRFRFICKQGGDRLLQLVVVVETFRVVVGPTKVAFPRQSSSEEAFLEAYEHFVVEIVVCGHVERI